MEYRIGVDVGGTFTDLVVLDSENNIYTYKVASTPKDPSVGFLAVLEKAAKDLGCGIKEFLGDTFQIVHGSTISTNAALTGQGARTSLITTRGFRDALEIRRSHRDSGIYNLRVGPPPPLAPRHLRLGVGERIDKDGNIVTPLDEESVREVISSFKAHGVEAIAVCLLFSFVNPAHEQRIEELIRTMYPGVYVSLSSIICPVIREYERTSTTVLNSYVGPLYSGYVNKIASTLKQNGFKRSLLLMQSNGGLATPEFASRHAANSLFSGPAAAPSIGALFAEIHGLRNVITLDIGGTSTDICLLEDGRSRIINEKMIGRHHLSVPMMDIHTIGTGGGAIARVDRGGLLEVGPESAGADPGPACYGKGGDDPTLTDAYLVLAYLNPDNFLGGEVKLDIEAARKAINDKVAKHLRLGLVEAAYGIFALASSRIVEGLRTVSIKRGYDPREFSLLLAGGAGPVHTCILAREMGVDRIFVPKLSPVFCALGQIASNLKYTSMRTYFARTKEANLAELNRIYEKMQEEASSALGQEKLEFARFMEMRYQGQIHEVDVELPPGKVRQETLNDIEGRFHGRHETLYSYSEDETGTEIVNLLLVATAKVFSVRIQEQEYGGTNALSALKGLREICIGAKRDYVEVPIYDGTKLRYGNEIEGPAVIEEIATTVVIFPGFWVSVDPFGNYVIQTGRK